MEEFLRQIELTLGARSYYATLFMCLCIPDICSALDSSNGRTTAARYETWFNTHVKTGHQRTDVAPHPYEPAFDGSEAYLLRCAALHQGQLANTGSGTRTGSKYVRIIFQEPAFRIIHLGVMDEGDGTALILDLQEFCYDMIASARAWISGVKGSQPFETNYAHMLKRYPEGVMPYVVGLPVIS